MTSIDTPISTAFATHQSRPSLVKRARAALARASHTLIELDEALHRARGRRRLLSLSDMALKDFGASRADAEAEGAKPFWRA